LSGQPSAIGLCAVLSIQTMMTSVRPVQQIAAGLGPCERPVSCLQTDRWLSESGCTVLISSRVDPSSRS